VWNKEEALQGVHTVSGYSKRLWPTIGQVRVTANDLPQPHRDWYGDKKTSMSTRLVSTPVAHPPPSVISGLLPLGQITLKEGSSKIQI